MHEDSRACPLGDLSDSRMEIDDQVRRRRRPMNDAPHAACQDAAQQRRDTEASLRFGVDVGGPVLKKTPMEKHQP